MANLGAPSEYEAFIVESATGETLQRLPWSSIKWQRVSREISKASVKVAAADGGVNCCLSIGGLFPWSQMIVIERNGVTVWDGPVLSWDIKGGDLTVNADDRSVLLQKRLIGAHRFLEDQTPNAVIRQLLTDALVYPTVNGPYTITVASGTADVELITREYFVERLEDVWRTVKELCDNTTTGYFCQVKDQMYLSESAVAAGLGGIGSSGRAIVLNEQTTVGLPSVHVDGRNMATVTYAGASGQGVNGFPLVAVSLAAQGLFLSSILERSSSPQRTGDDTDLTRIAGRGAAENAAPVFTMEQIRLSPNFGSEFLADDLSNLIPGVQFGVDFEQTCAFSVPIAEYVETAGVPGLEYELEVANVRMDQLDVTVSAAKGGIDEQVLASCRTVIN